MANGLDVMLAVVLALTTLAVGAEPALVRPSEPKTLHGQVIDSVTGKGIPGAFVLGRYSTGYGRQLACRWMEGAQTDAPGGFRLPILDAHGGMPLLEAFAPGYVRARPKRVARAEFSNEKRLWYVAIMENDAGQEVQNIVGRESALFETRQAAETAARQYLDAWLRPADTATDDYAQELRRVAYQVSCAQSGNVAPLLRMLDAILDEQNRVGADAADVKAVQGLRKRLPARDQRHQ